LSKLAPDLAAISLPSLVAAMPRNSTGMTVLLRNGQGALLSGVSFVYINDLTYS
jgi:hypothetical protein